MSDAFYKKQWERHLDTSFDSALRPILSKGMSWLPWVGRNYTKSKEKILIVGESNYTNEQDSQKVADKKAECQGNVFYQREVVAEYPLEGREAGWLGNSPTFDNLHRALLKTDLLAPVDMEKRGRLWDNLGYYNFVQRPMDYSKDRPKERPSYEDFYNGWRVFVQLVEVLHPKNCVFIGVQASNNFKDAMRDMGVEFTPVEWGEPINGVYTRLGGSVTIGGIKTQLIFMKHSSQYFSWELWNNHLETTIPDDLASLRNWALGEDIPSNKPCISVINEPIPDKRESTKDIPTWLSHKPIVACRYGNGFGDDTEDAKYLSVGRAQYDQQSASVKVLRHSGIRWSRQSEEVPIHRLGYMMQMLLSTIRLVQAEKTSPQTSLHEEIICPDELEFLKSEFHKNRDEIVHSIKEIKELVNLIDLEKI